MIDLLGAHRYVQDVRTSATTRSTVELQVRGGVHGGGERPVRAQRLLHRFFIATLNVSVAFDRTDFSRLQTARLLGVRVRIGRVRFEATTLLDVIVRGTQVAA